MEDDLPLPSLPDWNATEPVSPSRPKKRVRLSSPVYSSDPAMFSSDDDPSLDNYTNERQKRKFKGPWYEQKEASEHNLYDSQHNIVQKKSKRTFERQYDSGVFLGSDMTDMDEAFEEVSITARALPTRSLPKSSASKMASPTAESLARQQIDHCVENGIELIDLSSQSITTLSNETVRPLVAFTCLPSFFDGAIVHTYSRFEPKIQLFLASNNLTSLPEELFNLKNLAVLSLRGNQLYELPPSMGRLRNIVEINLSQNGLQYLPFEILDLFSGISRLEKFQIHPNPFHEPRYPPEEKQEEPADGERPYKIGLSTPLRRPRRNAVCFNALQYTRRKSWNPQWRVCYKARTEVRYMKIDGSHCLGPIFSNKNSSDPQKFSNGIPVAGSNYIPVPPRCNTISRAPSLLEVALRACSKTTELPTLTEKLPYESPAHFPDLLAYATNKKESGGSKCTICQRSFVIPRTEWIEWWEISKAVEPPSMASAASPLRQMENERDFIEKMVPLIRRGCSWLCVPEMLVHGEGAMDAE